MQKMKKSGKTNRDEPTNTSWEEIFLIVQQCIKELDVMISFRQSMALTQKCHMILLRVLIKTQFHLKALNLN